MSGRRPQAPPSAWRKMPWKNVPFASLDFEATGLNFSKDTIISFGVVPVTAGRIDVGDAVYQLVDPVDVPLDRQAIGVHMLRPLDLVDAPSLDAAREALRAALGRRFLITWFAEVEAAFLDKMFGGGPQTLDATRGRRAPARRRARRAMRTARSPSRRAPSGTRSPSPTRITPWTTRW